MKMLYFDWMITGYYFWSVLDNGWLYL